MQAMQASKGSTGIKKTTRVSPANTIFKCAYVPKQVIGQEGQKKSRERIYNKIGVLSQKSIKSKKA